jgi:hypothetical protein
MSQLTDFNEAGYSVAKSIIGTTSFTIGAGDSVQVIDAEQRHDRESEMNGFQASARLTLVCSRVDFVASYQSSLKSYVGKICVHDGQGWRVGDIEGGAAYITINLISRTEVS